MVYVNKLDKHRVRLTNLSQKKDNMLNTTTDTCGNVFHETAIVSRQAKIGFYNYFGAYCIVHENADIGDKNHFSSHCSIGSAPEHKQALESESPFFNVVIGDRNRFNEFTTVNAGAFRETKIGKDNFFLRGSYIGHDCIIGDRNTISCNVLIGGHSEIEDNCNLGLGSILHQFSYMGEGAMLGMGAIVTKKTKLTPYNIYVGNPANHLKINEYLIKKLGVNNEYIFAIQSRYNRRFSEMFLN